MSEHTPLPRKPFNPAPLWLALWVVVLAGIVIHLELSFAALVGGMGDIAEYLSRYGDPDFAELSRYLELLAETVATALWGTFFAVVAAAVLAPFAARNLTIGPWSYRLARELLNFTRAMPDLLLAMIFVAALGLGPMPGALALGVHTAGFLGKFFAESLERIEPGVIEAVRAVGGNRMQVVMYAGWPSILREALGYTLYIMDRNIRMATLLGLVGAGGIGVALHQALRLFNYGESAALILLILATLLAFDYLSTWLRGKLQ